ncbi:MAG: amino acid-binding protein [Candidatus Lokiarchaeota archaeon]|nr:amino acid-binding protein [Candidatus Lokiarchaeota archaeon]
MQNKKDLENFWEYLTNKFSNCPKRMEAIKLLLRLGFSIKDDKKIYCSEVQIPYRSISDALDMDRRSVKSAVKNVYNDKFLKDIFSNIQPAGIFLQGQERSIIEITAKSKKSGIIANVTKLIADEKISIRQVLATDPDLDPNPRLLIITNKEISGETISKIYKVEGVETAKLIKA